MFDSEVKGRTFGALLRVTDVDGKSKMRVDVPLVGETTADGTYAYRLFAGTATVPTTAHVAMRISAVCLPTEVPIIEATGREGAMSQTGGMKFTFTYSTSGN